MKAYMILPLLAICFGTYAQPTVLKLASDNWPPFTQEAPNEAVAIDLVKNALKLDHIAVKTSIEPFENVLSGIQEKTFDGSAALWYSDDRAKYLLFSKPYLTNQLVLVGKTGSDVSARSLADLKGKKIAIVDTYAYGKELKTAKNVTFIPGANHQENLNKLLAGEVDYMLVDALLVQYYSRAQEREFSANLVAGAYPLVKRSLHFAIRRDFPGAQEIIDNFNSHIVDMVKDGSYNKILHLEWVKADIDGDGIPELVAGDRYAGTAEPESGYSIMFTEGDTIANAQHKYYVEGRIYEAWDQIPETYKVKGPSEDAPGATLYRLTF